MRITILTLFPEMFQGPFDVSILKRAAALQLVTFTLVNIRDFAVDKRGTVDKKPYGGGTGMIMRVDVLDRAITHAKSLDNSGQTIVILLDPKGTPYTQNKASMLSRANHVVLVCGHYEGVDARVSAYVDETISIGDYVLTGGEMPAMVLVDSIVRLIPGALVKPGATTEESFSYPHDNPDVQKVLEYPHYTAPREYKGLKVPDVLLSGNHAKIHQWRVQQSYETSVRLRPDLIIRKK